MVSWDFKMLQKNVLKCSPCTPSSLQEAGGVVNIRLVSDFETGKPKGYAFVEYEDAATALSSIRNLNGFECNGRPVRRRR